MATIYSANSSNVLIDGDPLEGLQSLAFQVVMEREDIRAVGTDERVDVSFGLTTVQGSLVVRSASAKLDELLREKVKFQIVANLAKENGITAPGSTTDYAFDDCFVESKAFALTANGSAVTTYGFSATRVRAE